MNAESQIWPLIAILPWLILIGCCITIYWEWSAKK
jgi:hypothetical protein